MLALRASPLGVGTDIGEHFIKPIEKCVRMALTTPLRWLCSNTRRLLWSVLHQTNSREALLSANGKYGE